LRASFGCRGRGILLLRSESGREFFDVFVFVANAGGEAEAVGKLLRRVN
jgi:hypothetical protein